MDKLEAKIFRDNVHGYIHVPVDFVRLFIDTEIFQRLRNIEQTGMRTLYPSARHDRYIHSLGTYYLGRKAFENFRANVKEFSFKQKDEARKHYNVFNTGDDTIFWDKCGMLFQIACLLHDCGHAPFSHALEFLYEYPSSIRPHLKDKLKQCLATRDFRKDFVNQGSQHERMSALVICIEFWDSIEKFLETHQLKMDNDPHDVEFVARMIIGCKYGDDSKANRIKNCLISLLNSTSIDVDSLDYIVRDSKLSGIDNMSVDVDRLLSSLTLVEKTVFSNVRVRNMSIDTNVLNGVLTHISGSKAVVEGQYRGISRIKSLEGKIKGSISMAGSTKIKRKVPFKPANSNILKIGATSHTHIHEIPSTANEVDIELFGVTENWIEMRGSSLDIGKEYNGKMAVQADKFEIDSAYINGYITGLLTGELLGCYTDAGGRLTCELGFHKSSLSVIQNVLVARNYEYQWIYSHHKVVYYSNFLIIELFRLCIKYLLEKNGQDVNKYEKILTNILSWERMVKDDNEQYHPFEFQNMAFFRPVDSDITSIFKKCHILCLNSGDTASDCSRLLREYYTRTYKKSLWKSFAEYGIFFNDLSDNEKSKLYTLILANSTNSVIDQFGYFNDEWEATFNQYGLKNVVWVNADSKLKVLNPDNTCIVFKDMTLNYRTVALTQDVHREQKLNLFYIYYEEVEGIDQIDLIKMKAFIRDKMKAFV